MTAPDWTIHTDGTNRLALIEFDDVESFVAHSLRPVKRGRRHNRDQDQGEWGGNVTLAGAAKLATLGWPEGRAKFARNLEAYAAATSLGNDRTLTYDVAGFRPDVGRAIAGDPLSMIANGPELQTRAPVVSLAMSLHVSAAIDADQIIYWGCAVASHIDALEAAGYRVDLSVFPTMGKGFDDGPDNWLACRVTLKAPEQPLDLDRLAFWLAHPAALRRLGFANQDLRPDSFEDGHGGVAAYGMPAHLRKPIHYMDKSPAGAVTPKLARIVLPETAAYLPSAQTAYAARRFNSVATAVEVMRPCIEAALKLEDVTDA